MHILFILQLYSPDRGPSTHLFKILCKNLIDLGNDVTVITSVPHYPRGFVNKEYQKKILQRNKEDGVNVIRIRIPSLNRKNLFFRLMQSMVFQIFATYLSLVEDFDVAIIGNPGISKGLPLFSISNLRKKSVVYFVADIYPDVGVDAGIFRSKLLIATIEKVEHFCYSHSEIIWIFSENFATILQTKGVPAEKIILINGWVDINYIKPLPKDNSFSQEYYLNNKFVVLYAGNMGYSQGLDIILRSAQYLSGQTQIQFLFVGDGSCKENLVRLASEMELQNVSFLDFQSHDKFPEVLSSADVLIVSLKAGISRASIPSKIFSYLASARPILAIVDKETGVWSLIQKSGGGICASPGNYIEIAQNILKFKEDPEKMKKMGWSGRQWAIANHSPMKAALLLQDILTVAINKH